MSARIVASIGGHAAGVTVEDIVSVVFVGSGGFVAVEVGFGGVEDGSASLLVHDPNPSETEMMIKKEANKRCLERHFFMSPILSFVRAGRGCGYGTRSI
jgi:hypothetical protein